MVSGTVTDGMGAVIPGATARVVCVGETSVPAPPAQVTETTGSFSFSLRPGRYVLTVEAAGFAPYTSRAIEAGPSARVRLPVRLGIASLHEEISVLEDETTGGSDPNDLAGAIVLEGDKLNLLSDDNATLQQQLNALAGGFGSPHFLIDGFAGGRLPPKSSIRSIRVNRNPYSAYFADLGFGRVEINTKPGSDKLHGQLGFSGTDQPLNARDPYAGLVLPFYDFQQDGSVNGPLGKRTSFFASELTESLANTVAVNAADPQAPSVLLSKAAAAPQRTQTYSFRLDRQFAQKNFAYIREAWDQTHVENSGIVPLLLPEAAFNSTALTNTLQLSDTQMIGAHATNETRFQYLRSRLRQDPNSTAPSVVVQGSFQAGGSPAQILRDNGDVFELQDLFEFDRGRHAVRTGVRLRRSRFANESSAGFNGQYIFPDAAAYLARRPTQYSHTVGQPGATLALTETAVYLEDDLKVTPNLTFSYGFRYESDSALPDHNDPAPRLGFAWAIRPGKRKTPIVTLRGGYGLFYDRFPIPQRLQAIRQDGVREIAFIAKNPGFNPDGPPAGLLPALAQPTTYRVDPHLHTSYVQAASLTVNRSLGRRGAVSANLIYQHDAHDYLTRNVNAPLPGTFSPGNPGSGTRPLGTQANLYQFSSDANGNLERFFLNYRFQATKRLFAFGVFDAEKNYSEADGIGRFPSNQYDLRQDYARASLSRAQAFTGGLQWALPHDFQVMPFLSTHSGAPFDLTTGTDLNGDTIYNDRPAFALEAASASLVRTSLGAFDVAPAPGRTALPRNYGTSPGYLWIMLRAEKDFHLGPRPQAPQSAVAGGSAATPDRPWDLKIGVEVHNLTNHNNPGLPIGTIAAVPCASATDAACTCGAEPGQDCRLAPSPYFGRSLSLAPDFSPITASNRTILLQTSFSW